MNKSGVIYVRRPPLYQRLFSLLSLVAAFILILFSSQDYLIPKANVASAWNYQHSPNVSIRNMQFSPSQIVAPLGATIIWRNYDSVPHTVTSDSGIWDSGVLQPGQAIAIRISAPGTFPYHCRIHPFMHGVIVVTNTTSPTSPAYPRYGYMAPNAAASSYYQTSYQHMYYGATYSTTPVYYSNNYLKNSYPVDYYPTYSYGPNINYYVLNPQNNPEANAHPAYTLKNSYPLPSHPYVYHPQPGSYGYPPGASRYMWK